MEQAISNHFFYKITFEYDIGNFGFTFSQKVEKIDSVF